MITIANDTASEPQEPHLELVQRIHVRRDNDLATLAQTVAGLLDAEGCLVDLSHYDWHADVIQLRAGRPVR